MTLRQQAAAFRRHIRENPSILRTTIREAAPAATAAELDKLTDMFIMAMDAPERERAALYKKYCSELQKYKPAQSAEF